MTLQPDFIFGCFDQACTHPNFGIGVVLAIAVAVLSGFVRVLLTICVEVASASTVMTTSGVAYLLIGTAMFHPWTYGTEQNIKFAILSGVESALSSLLLLIASKVMGVNSYIKVRFQLELLLLKL